MPAQQAKSSTICLQIKLRYEAAKQIYLLRYMLRSSILAVDLLHK